MKSIIALNKIKTPLFCHWTQDFVFSAACYLFIFVLLHNIQSKHDDLSGSIVYLSDVYDKNV